MNQLESFFVLSIPAAFFLYSRASSEEKGKTSLIWFESGWTCLTWWTLFEPGWTCLTWLTLFTPIHDGTIDELIYPISISVYIAYWEFILSASIYKAMQVNADSSTHMCPYDMVYCILMHAFPYRVHLLVVRGISYARLTLTIEICAVMHII